MANLDLNAKYTAPANADNDSRKYMIYTSDDGSEYSVLISENIGEVFGFGDISNSSPPPALPQYFKMRHINAVDSTGKVRNTFPVGKTGESVYNEGGTVKVARKGKADGLVLAVTGAVGERKRFATSDDSGQQSGDNT